MRLLNFSTVALFLAAGSGACSTQSSGSSGPADAQAADAQSADAGASDARAADAQATSSQATDSGAGEDSARAAQADGGAAADSGGGMVAECGADPNEFSAGIASAQLNATPPVKLTERLRLMADDAPHDPVPQQGIPAGLRWQQDRMFLLLDPGFWDIPVAGPARWYATSTVLVEGVRAADIDGDGDQDIMLLSTRKNDAADSATSPLVTRLSVWERTRDGLTERGEVLRGARLVLPMPFVFADLGGDASLDIITFEQGAPVGYLHDGKFGFTRTVLGQVAADYASMLLLALDYSDRNADGKPDLLVVVGKELENTAFVMLADGAGKFSPPSAEFSKGKSPLVPYGPTGTGIGFADVTGDGVSDILMQDPQGTDSAPRINLYASAGATSLAAAVQLEGLDFQFADLDKDGQTDIVSTLNGRLMAMLSHGKGGFESRDMGVSTSKPSVLDFVVDPGQANSPAVIHILYKQTPCPPCNADCAGRCVLDACIACLSDADCTKGRCSSQTCTP